MSDTISILSDSGTFLGSLNALTQTHERSARVDKVFFCDVGRTMCAWDFVSPTDTATWFPSASQSSLLRDNQSRHQIQMDSIETERRLHAVRRVRAGENEAHTLQLDVIRQRLRLIWGHRQRHNGNCRKPLKLINVYVHERCMNYAAHGSAAVIHVIFGAIILDVGYIHNFVWTTM